MYVVSRLKEQQLAESRKRQQVIEHVIHPDRLGSTPTWEPGGWLTARTPSGGVGDQDPLVRHANFLGPRKLIGRGDDLRQLTEVFVSRDQFADQVFDGASQSACESVLAELDAAVFNNRSPLQAPQWHAPDTEQLDKWFEEGGFTPVADADGNQRLTLKTRGRDGQVRVHRDDHSLRITMRLGSWSSLDDAAEQAMLGLARQANQRGRLARIAWYVDGDSRRCEAQVDLTGLPAVGAAERIWSEMLCMSMQAFKLALGRLAMELEVLADPKNSELAAQLLCGQLQT